MCPDIPPLPGSYVLILHLPQDRVIPVGRLGHIPFPAGYYLYMGSARGPGGLRARIARHLRRQKRLHWHVDYLLHWTRPVEIWYSHSVAPLECHWREVLMEAAGLETAATGFGSSDCPCHTHLLYSQQRPAAAVAEALAQATGLSVHRRTPPA